MAKIRRSGQQVSSSIWPGFVDAMTALLLVLMFVLTIFMIVQFVLRDTISTQDTQLNYLSQQVASLAEALGLEQQKTDGLETEVDALTGELVGERSQAEIQAALIATLSQQTKSQNTRLDEFEVQVSSFEAQVASLLAERTQLQADNAGLEDQVTSSADENAALVARISEVEAANLREISDKEALQLALASARDEIDQGAEAARLAAAKREALESLIAQTQASLTEREVSLQAVLQSLEATRSDLGASETSLSELEQQLANITADLTTEEKARLAEEAAALALQKRLADTENALTEEEKTRLVEAAAAEALRKKLEGATAELTAMTLTLEEQRRAAEDTLTLLAAADVARKQVDDFLAAALLAQTNAETAGAEARIAVLVSDKDALDDRLAAVIAQLEATGDESSSLLADAVTTREDLETRLATALAAKLAAEQDAGVVLSKSEQRRILLAEANKSLSDEKARSAESLREIALLNQQTATLRKQLNALQALLDLAKAKDVEANVQLESLGANLNTALAQVAAEQKRLAREQTLRAELEEAERKRLELEAKDLEKFKSEFFGQMRELLGDREGVRIVGDRFVFSSEILFPAGSTDLALEGQAAIAKVAGVIRDVADKIPSDIDWILRVDGHTDNVPLSGNGIYQDNWQLSQARALSVVRYLIEDLDMPADRLAATGFGEFQPLNSANTPTARAQNRRIELKFTER
jgi:chemotaxis protein MotB